MFQYTELLIQSKRSLILESVWQPFVKRYGEHVMIFSPAFHIENELQQPLPSAIVLSALEGYLGPRSIDRHTRIIQAIDRLLHKTNSDYI